MVEGNSDENSDEEQKEVFFFSYAVLTLPANEARNTHTLEPVEPVQAGSPVQTRV